jgi:hypothetical protein
MPTNDLLGGLPGEDLIRQGLADLKAGRRTVAGCLAAMARPRLEQAALFPPQTAVMSAEAELELYRLLRKEPGDAYSRYNALVRELVSFESALDRRLRRTARPACPLDIVAFPNR